MVQSSLYGFPSIGLCFFKVPFGSKSFIRVTTRVVATPFSVSAKHWYCPSSERSGFLKTKVPSFSSKTTLAWGMYGLPSLNQEYLERKIQEKVKFPADFKQKIHSELVVPSYQLSLSI